MNTTIQIPRFLTDYILVRSDNAVGAVMKQQAMEFCTKVQAEEFVAKMTAAGVGNCLIVEANSIFAGWEVQYAHADAPRVYEVHGSVRVPNDIAANGQQLPDHIIPVKLSVGKQLDLYRRQTGQDFGQEAGPFGDNLAWQEGWQTQFRSPGEPPSVVNFDWRQTIGRVPPPPGKFIVQY